MMMDDRSSNLVPQQHHTNVLIVGAGMAGLTCAQELLLQNNNNNNKQFRVTMVEATNVAGGRIRSVASSSSSHQFPVGAEYVHGHGTMLTRLLETLRETNYYWSDDDEEEEEVFILPHADGGPQTSPTKDGKYGMFYFDNQLKLYNDECFQVLTNVLEGILEDSAYDNENDSSPRHRSLGHALAQDATLSDSLRALAVASYGNTAACSNLDDLSLPMIQQFEAWWEDQETPKDVLLKYGLQPVVQAFVKYLLDYQASNENSRLDILYNWPVQRIREDCDSGKVLVKSEDGSTLSADAVVVTVPPPILLQLDMPLTEEKKHALSLVGFERIIKVCLLLRKRHWSSDIQNLVCANQQIPEIWFQQVEVEDNAEACRAVGFVTSRAADAFAASIVEQTTEDTPDTDVAKGILLQQLATMFQVPLATLQESVLDAAYFDWKEHKYAQGGYMYPRVGLTKRHLEQLAAPSGNIYFAGEATHTEACCTIQAAMETGARAAQQIMERCKIES